MSGGPGARSSSPVARRRRSAERFESQRRPDDADNGVASRMQSLSSSSPPSPPASERYSGYVHTLKPDYGFIRRRGVARDLHFWVHAVERGPVRLHSRVTCETTIDGGRSTGVRVRLAEDDNDDDDGVPGSRATRERLPDGWTERRVYRGACVRAHAGGFGFIQPDDRAVKDGDTVFFHTTGLAPGVATVALHQLVTFGLRLDSKYGLCAIEVAPVSDYGSESYRHSPAASIRRRQRSLSPPLPPLPPTPQLSPRHAYPRDPFVSALAASSVPSASSFSHRAALPSPSSSPPPQALSHANSPRSHAKLLLPFAPQLSIAIDRPSADGDLQSLTLPQRSPRTPLTPTVVFDTWHHDWQPPGALAYRATDRHSVSNLLHAVSSSVTYPDSPPSSPTPPPPSSSQFRAFSSYPPAPPPPHRSSSFPAHPFENRAVAPSPSASHLQQSQWVTTHCHRPDSNAYLHPHHCYPPSPPPPPPQYPAFHHPTPPPTRAPMPMPPSVDFYSASAVGGGALDGRDESQSPCTDASELMRALDTLGTAGGGQCLGEADGSAGDNRSDADKDESKEELYEPEPASLTPPTAAPTTVLRTVSSSSSSSSPPRHSSDATRADTAVDPTPRDVWDRRETFTDFVDYFRALAGTALSTGD